MDALLGVYCILLLGGNSLSSGSGILIQFHFNARPVTWVHVGIDDNYYNRPGTVHGSFHLLLRTD